MALWWIGILILVAFWPRSLFPYRPAMELRPRFYAPLTVPGALLTARMLVLLGRGRWRIPAGLAAGLAATLALFCTVRLHQDAMQWRAGPEWAREELLSVQGRGYSYVR